MAKTVEIRTLTKTGVGPTGDLSYEATGACDGKAFIARTIIYAGEPVFKVYEMADGKLACKSLADSAFDRGERIAIARMLKDARLNAPDGWADDVADDVADDDDLETLTVGELRGRCKSAGISGYYKRVVRKADLVRMLRSEAA